MVINWRAVYSSLIHIPYVWWMCSVHRDNNRFYLFQKEITISIERFFLCSVRRLANFVNMKRVATTEATDVTQ